MANKKTIEEMLDGEEMVLVNKGAFMLLIKTALDFFSVIGIPVDERAELVAAVLFRSKMSRSFMEDLEAFLSEASKEAMKDE